MEKLRALPRTLSSKRGSWIWLGIVLIVFVAMFGAFGRATAPALNATAPANSESTQVAELLKQFPNADQQSVIVVSTANDGAALSPAHLSAMKGLLPAIEKETGLAPSGPVPSEDGKAAVIIAPMTLTSDNSENADHLKALRAVIADKKTSSSDLNAMQLQVTGGPAFGADIAGAFEGADIQLLLVTIAIVAVLLMLTYRSPVLWLIPLIVVAFADQLAGKVTAWLGTQASLQFDTGIISVLVFGAGTNYALLFISRYREELPRFADHRQALAEAWKRTAPAILASNVTVVIALATLVFAAIPGTRGLGIASAVGLLIALAAVLFALPPVLAIFGRKIFWPFIPRFTESTVESVVELPGELQEEKPKELGKLWRSIATNVVRRPVVCLTAALALLAIMATGLIGSSVGLNQIEKFRVQSESATGLQVLSEHFSPGEAQPMMIVSNSAQAKAVADRAAEVGGVVRSQIAGETEDGKLTKIMVTSEYAPGTPESLAQVNDLRNAVHDVPEANALVGGAVATDADARTGNIADFLLVAPLVLGVSFLVLLILLRSLVAPVLLLAANIVSATAAIGAGAWLSRSLFNQPALDLQVPLLAFLFLVALGIDYTIFLVHRAKTEAATHGTREGMVRAVASTGGVITSAGIVLAGVFAALGILPLVTLGQLGLIVGIGVVVDTLVVRTVLVPAIFSLLGDKIWWPGKVPAQAVDAEEASAPLGSNANLTAARSAHPAAANEWIRSPMTSPREPVSSLTAKNAHTAVTSTVTPSAPSSQGRAVSAMQWGQHVIAVVLSSVAAIRAVTDGTHPGLAIGAAVALLAWYAVGILNTRFRQDRKASQIWLLVFTAIWAGGVVVSAEFIWLAFLLWLLAGHLFRWRSSIWYALVVFAVVVLAPVMHHGTTSYANVLGPLIGGIFALAISRGYLELLKDAREREALVAALQRTHHELLDVQDELALSQHHAGAIAERTRISRDIHDTVAQSLTSIRMLALAQGTKLADADGASAEARATLQQIETISRESIADVRRIVAALAPAELEHNALGEALERIVSRFREETGLRADLTIDATLPALSTEYDVALLRVAQSALANVRLHAKASRVVVSLLDSDDSVRLDILDDGQGMDVSSVNNAPRDADSSFGLGFIRARLRELSGGLDLESTPGEGTVLSAHLPLRREF